VTAGTSALIGFNGRREHEVFSVVCDTLQDRGHRVRYLDATRTVDTSTIRELDLLVNKSTRPGSIHSLVLAERLGVSTWNSATGVLVCAARTTQLCALDGVGFETPALLAGPSDEDYIAKSRFHWGPPPTINGEGDLYEELLDVEPIDYKYYLVDTGDAVQVCLVRATSKLFDTNKRVLGTGTPQQALVRPLKRLLSVLEMKALGVDFVRTPDGRWIAVDLNPGPSFRETGLERQLVDSIEGCLPTSGST
jgi:hypothetical protein